MRKILFIIISIFIIFIACEENNKSSNIAISPPPSGELVTNVTTVVESSSILLETYCSREPDDQIDFQANVNGCESIEGCQAVYNLDGTEYLGCTPMPDYPDNDDPIDGEDIFTNYYCDKKSKMIFLCLENHNTSVYKTLCVSLNSWVNYSQEEQKNHKFTLGACNPSET